MFEKLGAFKPIGDFPSEESNIKRVYKFQFETEKHKYLADAELFEGGIFMLKFYLRSHKKHQGSRFSHRTNEGVAVEILGTCLNIALYLYKKFPKASFGFIGVNDKEEEKANCKRYRVYKLISIRFFSETKFNHFEDDTNSLYLMLNKDNLLLNETNIKEEISRNYNILIN